MEAAAADRFLRETRYSANRRQTVDHVGGERSELIGKTGLSSRRETSAHIGLAEATSRKTLITTTEHSKKQLQEIVIPDPNEGLDLEEYNKALLYISCSPSKKRELTRLA